MHQHFDIRSGTKAEL